MEEPMKPLLIVLTLLLAILTLSAEKINVSGYQNDFRLTSNNTNAMQLEFTLGSFEREPVTINGVQWNDISLPKEALTLEAGMPQLPTVSRSVIIPGTAAMQLNVLSSEYIDLSMPVAPSKGNLTRDIDPSTIPYSFAEFYQSNGSYPQVTADLSEPFILRDYRGITIRVMPFIYFPGTSTLRVYTKMLISLQENGSSNLNALSATKRTNSQGFEEIYRNMFLNFDEAKYPSIGEEGSILVIKHSMFDSIIQPWVDWKRQIGFNVEVVDITVAGPSANNIKTYIQNYYNTHSNLMFVQLFGDAPQIPTLSVNGGGSDPSFSLVAGTDSYPDIYIGRFSASTVADMQTQLDRSIYYERDIAVGATYLEKATGIASNEGGGSQGDNGESDATHMNNIRTDLLAYGYNTVDQIYQGTGGNASGITAALNNGRGFVNYVGHGSDTSWASVTYTNSNVSSLSNYNMLPFIVSVACVNGNFVSQTCFAEAWLRAKNASTGAPTGAIAFYGSTVNQGWNPPMRGQDEVTDLLIAGAKHRIGSLYFNGSSKMIEAYSTSGIAEFKNWTIFGDASLMVRTKNPTLIASTYNPVLLMGVNTFSIQTEPFAKITLSNAGTIYATGAADATGSALLILNPAPAEPMNLTLTVFAFDKQTQIETVQVLPNSGPYIMMDDISVSDSNDGLPQFGETVQLSMDLSNIGSQDATGATATISSTDPHITIINPTLNLGDIAAGANSPFGSFNIQIGNTIPDQHEVNLHIVITDANSNSFEFDRNFLVNAPAITWGGIVVDDANGNNNGRVDAGESVIFTLPISNTGHCATSMISSNAMIAGITHILEPVAPTVDNLMPGETASLMYRATFSSQIPAGTSTQLTVMSLFGEYVSANNYSFILGLDLENFESGLTASPWIFSGGSWTTSQSTSYNGSQTAKSPFITHGTSSSMSISKTITQTGSITFWKKVSSEASYDKLSFHINGLLMGEWSGNTDEWSQVSFPVTAGNNYFTWKYTKDGGTSVGSDCAWIDDIIYPSSTSVSGTPSMLLGTQTLDFEIVQVGETLSLPLTISNTGTASMMGSLTSVAPFYMYNDLMEPVLYLDYIIPAGESMVVDVNFIPTSQQLYSAEMVITSDDPSVPVITVGLEGSGQPVANDDLINPLQTKLVGNYPNPFNPNTTIKFSLKEQSPVNVTIFNISGQKVITLVNETMPAGTYNLPWNGKDSKGRGVGSGIYFFKMDSGKYTSTKKMIMLK